MFIRRFAILGALTLFISGCGETEWQTKDIDGLMPALEFTLTSEDGQTVTAEQYTGTVNLLFFGYTNCPDICPITLGRLRAAIDRLPSDADKQVRVLFVSVDPERDRPELLRDYTSAFGDDVVGLTGSKSQLDALTKRYRTTYGYGDPDKNGNYLVSHASAVFAFDMEGKPRLLIRSDDSPEAIAGDIARLVEG